MVILTPKLCVVVGGNYAEESYTCVRTSGAVETGWAIRPHVCGAAFGSRWEPAGSAHFDREHLGKEGPFWRVFLCSAVGVGHSCGWRPVGTFWPSRLDGDSAAQKEWSAALIAHLDALEAARDKSGDPDYDAPPRRI